MDQESIDHLLGLDYVRGETTNLPAGRRIQGMPIAGSQHTLIQEVDKARMRLAAMRAHPAADPPLPDWALLPLRMAGMSAAEIRQLSRAGVRERDSTVSAHQIREAEADLEILEEELIDNGPDDLRAVRLMLELALDHAREAALADGRTVFYDSPESRLARLLDRAVQALASRG